jgi:hypothetical protein
VSNSLFRLNPIDHLGFSSLLKSLPLPQPGSNRGYDPIQLITQFMMSVWCGADAYEQCEVTRFDDVLRRIFNFEKMAGHRAISRFFGKFNQKICNEVFDEAYRWFFSSLHINYVTLDLDSTVMTRYGKQDGATKGYTISHLKFKTVLNIFEDKIVKKRSRMNILLRLFEDFGPKSDGWILKLQHILF